MHELNLAVQIVEKAKKKGDVRAVTVEVGDLAHVQPSEIKDALAKLVDWKLVIQRKPALVRCSCGYEGNPRVVEKRHGLTLIVCPKCSTLPMVVEGNDIILKSVEVR